MSYDLAARQYREALMLLSDLEAAGFEARLAGGCVRDRLMGLAPQDYDIVTSATPPEVFHSLGQRHRRLIPTGIDHGTYTVTMPSGPIEVTTLREDVETDGRRAKVIFGTSFPHDALRRDFTINALFEDKSGKIYDYIDGLSDLKHKTLKFVGDPSQRIREDYLRILRMFRFWARLNFNPAPGSVEAIADEKSGLSVVSQERITSELFKILAAPHLMPALGAMLESGVMGLIIPEITVSCQILHGYFAKSPTPWSTELSGNSKALATLTSLVLLGADWSKDAQKPSELYRSLTSRIRLSRKESEAIATTLELAQRLHHGGSNQAPPNQALTERELFPDVASCLNFVERCETEERKFADFFLPILQLVARIADPQFSTWAHQLNKISSAENAFGYRRKSRLPLSGHIVTQLLSQWTPESGGAPMGLRIGQAMDQLRIGFLNGEWASEHEGREWLGNKFRQNSES